MIPTATSNSTKNQNEPLFDPTEVDEYGWVCVNKGKWYNSFSKLGKRTPLLNTVSNYL